MSEGRALRFPMIDGLRGVAALSVLYYHAAHKAFLGNTGPEELLAWTSHLDVGVTLFFLISGLVLYRPFVEARLAGRKAPDRDEYARRRFWRIVPAYWVVLVIAGVLGLSYVNSPEIFSAQGIPAYFGFLQIYNANTAAGGINTAWTLCVEVTFYAMLPVWAYCLRRFAKGRRARSEYLALGGLAVASLAFQAYAVHQVNPMLFGGAAALWIEPLPNFLDQFAIGMALAVASLAWHREGPRGFWAWLADRPWVPWLFALAAYWAMSTQIGLSGAPGDEMPPLTYLALHVLKSCVALGLILPAVLPGGLGAIRRLLTSRVLLFAGAISYGIYLVQVPAMLGLIDLGVPRAGFGAQLTWLLAVTSLVVASAWVLHRLVELPAMRYGRSTARKPTTVGSSPRAEVKTTRTLLGLLTRRSKRAGVSGSAEAVSPSGVSST